ncbi:MAG: glycosyltransferase family 4 protein [Thaumarchaeota archaeon]|nr:glycosyltransferase family 4 protein [Nitrososphaerota archaeon]
MKIGIIHGFVGGGGGTEPTLLALIEALKEHGHAIHLYTVSRPTIQLPKIKITSVFPFRLPAFGLYQRFLESELTKKARDDDLIIQVSGGIALPQRKDQKIIIYCHHDFRNETEKDVTKYKGMWSAYYRPYYLLSQKFVSRMGDENIILAANSRFIRDSIKERFGKDSVVIYPPVDTGMFKDGTAKEARIVTVSRYSQEKNLEFAMEAAGGIGMSYDIIGNTKTRINEVYYENLEKLRRQKSLDNVNLLKNIERPRLIETLKVAKVYFHASPETFGISVVEGIAAGCVPVVPDNSAHKETVPFDRLRYEPNNKQDAQEKLRKALSGEYDDMLGMLGETVSNYSKDSFKKAMVNLVEM